MVIQDQEIYTEIIQADCDSSSSAFIYWFIRHIIGQHICSSFQALC